MNPTALALVDVALRGALLALLVLLAVVLWRERPQSPFEVTQLQAAPDNSFTTHALNPQALLQVFCDLRAESPPPCTLLAIRGEAFDLGAPPSPAAQAHLADALPWARAWLAGQRAGLFAMGSLTIKA